MRKIRTIKAHSYAFGDDPLWTRVIKERDFQYLMSLAAQAERLLASGKSLRAELPKRRRAKKGKP